MLQDILHPGVALADIRDETQTEKSIVRSAVNFKRTRGWTARFCIRRRYRRQQRCQYNKNHEREYPLHHDHASATPILPASSCCPGVEKGKRGVSGCPDVGMAATVDERLSIGEVIPS
ncbi:MULTISPECIES: hypothetical protein [unclassified Methanoculleus]|uniref:hypothetical protein n=1 Tax=unclassified Methanoculleus TaxID=2619537 RepID=UPI0025F1B94A|nr:hypothetical protein [Methanoculleus sp. UBA430]HOI59594.1 hypothetical protein [Methanoculleus sp.]